MKNQNAKEKQLDIIEMTDTDLERLNGGSPQGKYQKSFWERFFGKSE